MKYAQIIRTLKAQILGNTYAVGEALPSEHELAQHFSVSRMTIRRALDELQRHDIVSTIHGIGTFPTGRNFQQGTFRVRPLQSWTQHPPTQLS